MNIEHRTAAIASLLSVNLLINVWSVSEIKPNKWMGHSILLNYNKNERLRCSIDGCDNKVIGRIDDKFCFIYYCKEHKNSLLG